MKKSLLYILLIGVFLSCSESTQASLYIATAANMQFAMEALIQSFEQEQGVACEMVVSSSGKLTAQILQGAPYDVFVSADMKYPRSLFEKGKTLHPPSVYAHGHLVLWSEKTDLILNPFPEVLDLLKSNSIQHIALANPQTAPYGKAALEVLQHYDLKNQLESKLVYGESIAQANQFITTQAAEVGFTAKSVVIALKKVEQDHWISVPVEVYEPIRQGVVLLQTGKKPNAVAQNFYNFLFTPKARKILNTFGYDTDFRK